MNKNLSYIAAAVFFVGAANVKAASGVDLTVKGVITPAACVPQLSNSGVVDHGKISIKDLNYETTLPEVTLQMSVSCDASTLFAIQSTDNREGTAASLYPSPSLFGLGLSADNQKLGSYLLTMDNVLADGIAHPLVESFNGTTWFSASAGTAWQPGWMRTVGARGSSGTTPVAVQNLVSDVVIATTIKKPTMTTEEIPLDGSATLSIVYL
ncbi:DUF1120 domain-containing protein [Pseudomonas sp. PGPR40]|uniref:DUF1120 domain-containing protein n=1 Tax=Pseudomonas sp. PGPR40 TaxID=2913476 RepID=UPI001EDA44FA|nr:DUF1120 domain-containing protein [Pseudomonas sp. PGPR40]